MTQDSPKTSETAVTLSPNSITASPNTTTSSNQIQHGSPDSQDKCKVALKMKDGKPVEQWKEELTTDWQQQLTQAEYRLSVEETSVSDGDDSEDDDWFDDIMA